ncbi:MAG: methyltransferase domain-containing protein [Chlamydiota bacterium]
METKPSGYKKVKSCRVSRDEAMIAVLNLGDQKLTGLFPKVGRDHEVMSGPIELVWSSKSGLLQLAHSYDPHQMYGENYGYRSGLNRSMVTHLTDKVASLERLVGLGYGDTVLDIGSNDGTTLKAYSIRGIDKIGIDPAAKKFARFYREDMKPVADFFSEENYRKVSKKNAKVVTSIAMFYDLEDPIQCAREIARILTDDGVWHLEQSYMPTMLRLNSYDTVCHEHIAYYSLRVMEKIMDAAGLKIIDVSMNAINGGSFALTCVKRRCIKYPVNRAVIQWLLMQEDRIGLHTLKPFREFERRVFKHRERLLDLVKRLVADGKKVLGYGASTKGNVMLQFCGFTPAHIAAIAEVNEDKFGCMTPGSAIPIVSESEALAMEPDYFLVLPWHFRNEVLRREKRFHSRRGRFIFPFPEIEIV